MSTSQFWNNDGKASRPDFVVGSMGMFAPPVTSSSYAAPPLFASSWPAVTPSRMRYEPPAAPSRKPSLVNWEVPPLELPVAPCHKKLSGNSSDTFLDDASGGGFSLDACALEEGDEEDDEEEAGVFALDGGGTPLADEDDFPGVPQFNLVGLDGDDFASITNETMSRREVPTSTCPVFGSLPAGGAFGVLHRNRSPSEGDSPILGASPTLLSALELVAAQAGTRARTRLGSC